jgi:SAM-dependent methyltransferase
VTTAPTTVYGAALRRASAGERAGLWLVDRIGTVVRRADAGDWSADLRPGDASLLERCRDRTLDLGCGPGRMTAALVAAGRRAVGVDVSPQAVRLTRRRGVPALLGDLFDPLPGEGGWGCALLADGNIGIGGDAVRLLRRCRDLVRRRGSVLVEVDAPGAPTWSGAVRLADGRRTSTAFAWAFVGADEIGPVAGRAALRTTEIWTEAGRWFAHLTP